MSHAIIALFVIAFLLGFFVHAAIGWISKGKDETKAANEMEALEDQRDELIRQRSELRAALLRARDRWNDIVSKANAEAKHCAETAEICTPGE